MAERRNRQGRFMRGGGRKGARHERRTTTVRRGYRRVHGIVRGFGSRIGSAFPRWAKPSRLVATATAGIGIGELVMIPLDNGDSWVGRLVGGYEGWKSSGNPMELLAMDEDGNNTISIALIQAKQNLPAAAWTWISGGIGAAALKWAGM